MNALMYGTRIQPDTYAVFVEEREVEKLTPPKEKVEKAQEAKETAEQKIDKMEAKGALEA
jgi:hypothetical protein